MLPCKTEDCDGEVETGWRVDQEIVACSKCGRKYRVWGDETFDDETEEAFDWWALTDPDGDDPWAA